MFAPFIWQVGRTERIENNLNPNFSKSIIVDYFFEELQKLKFLVYDIDSASGSLKNADFLGEMQCTLGQVSMSAFHLPFVGLPVSPSPSPPPKKKTPLKGQKHVQLSIIFHIIFR